MHFTLSRSETIDKANKAAEKQREHRRAAINGRQYLETWRYKANSGTGRQGGRHKFKPEPIERISTESFGRITVAQNYLGTYKKLELLADFLPKHQTAMPPKRLPPTELPARGPHFSMQVQDHLNRKRRISDCLHSQRAKRSILRHLPGSHTHQAASEMLGSRSHEVFKSIKPWYRGKGGK